MILTFYSFQLMITPSSYTYKTSYTSTMKNYSYGQSGRTISQ